MNATVFPLSETITGPAFRVVAKRLLREYKLSEDPADIFDGYAMHRGKEVRVYRRWRGQGPGKIGKYEETSRLFFEDRPIDFGEDPRPFTHNGHLNIVSAVFAQGFGYRAHLIEFDHNMNWTRSILVPPTGLSVGKNWAPFVLPDGRLAFIHSYSPLKLLVEMRREVGAILLGLVNGIGIPFEEGDGTFAAHRGGTNGISIGTSVFGIGHTTKRARDKNNQLIVDPSCLFHDSVQMIHRPFGWCLDLAASQLREIPITGVQWDERFFIIDPTSVIHNEITGRFDMYTTEVNRHFHQPDDVGQACCYELELINPD